MTPGGLFFSGFAAGVAAVGALGLPSSHSKHPLTYSGSAGAALGFSGDSQIAHLNPIFVVIVIVFAVVLGTVLALHIMSREPGASNK
jgi:hypothetical protein